MDDRRGDAQTDRGAPAGSAGEKHGWLRFDRYQAIHEGALERHGFVLEDATHFDRTEDPRRPGEVVRLTGIVRCDGGIVITVEKHLDLRVRRGREEVRAYFYAYNAHVPGRGNLLRYDNAHLGAPDEYHRHEYDLATGVEVRRDVLTREQFPTLIELVDELQQLARAAGLR